MRIDVCRVILKDPRIGGFINQWITTAYGIHKTAFMLQRITHLQGERSWPKSFSSSPSSSRKISIHRALVQASCHHIHTRCWTSALVASVHSRCQLQQVTTVAKLVDHRSDPQQKKDKDNNNNNNNNSANCRRLWRKASGWQRAVEKELQNTRREARTVTRTTRDRTSAEPRGLGHGTRRRRRRRRLRLLDFFPFSPASSLRLLVLLLGSASLLHYSYSPASSTAPPVRLPSPLIIAFRSSLRVRALFFLFFVSEDVGCCTRAS